LAFVTTGSQLEKLCRLYRAAGGLEGAIEPEERSVRRRLLPGGMVKLELVLAPDEAELILRAVQRAREVEAERTEQAECEEHPAGESAGDVSAEGAPGEAWVRRMRM